MKPHALILAAVLSSPIVAYPEDCRILKAGDLEPALGKVTLGGTTALPAGEMCAGKTATHSLVMRRFKRTNDPGGEKERAGLEAMKSAGMKVDVQKFGDVTCVAVEGQGRSSTSCSASKAPMYAVIEASGKDALPIAKLRPVAEKLLSGL